MAEFAGKSVLQFQIGLYGNCLAFINYYFSLNISAVVSDKLSCPTEDQMIFCILFILRLHMALPGKK